MFEAKFRGSSTEPGKRQKMIAEADAARDRGDYAKAEFLYYQLLSHFDDLDGYIVQYAHSLKEQGKFSAAEFFYRDALNRGVDAAAILEHLEFVCGQQNQPVGRPAAEAAPAVGLARLPNSTDIRILSWLLRDDSEPPLELRLAVIRQAASVDQAAVLLAQSPEALHRNRKLLSLMEAST